MQQSQHEKVSGQHMCQVLIEGPTLVDPQFLIVVIGPRQSRVIQRWEMLWGRISPYSH
jgi:hypothetical protein